MPGGEKLLLTDMDLTAKRLDNDIKAQDNQRDYGIYL